MFITTSEGWNIIVAKLGVNFPCLKAGVKEGLQAIRGDYTCQNPEVSLTMFVSVCIFPVTGRKKKLRAEKVP